LNISSLINLYKEGPADKQLLNKLIGEYLDLIARREDDALQKKLLKDLIQKYVSLEKRVDRLLKNTLPEKVAEEIKYEGTFTPRQFYCTILFSDFSGFTMLAETIPHGELIAILDEIFSGFDTIVSDCRGTKVKTIGDAYMAVFGAPEPYKEHAVKAVEAGLEMQDFVRKFNKKSGFSFGMRVGIHTGSVMAGVVGRERMQFDIFGDNVNIASRYETAGEKNKVNISYVTYMESRDHFIFEGRGSISLKNKGKMKAYFVLQENGKDHG